MAAPNLVRGGTALVLAESHGQAAPLRDALRGENFSTLVATEAEEALARLRERAFDLVILEVRSPGNGEEAAVDLGELTRRLRREETSASRRAWVLVIAPTIARDELLRLRNCGISSLLLGELTIGALAERLALMRQDKRRFVIAPGYVGPDRRVRHDFFPPEKDRRGTGSHEAQTAPDAEG